MEEDEICRICYDYIYIYRIGIEIGYMMLDIDIVMIIYNYGNELCCKKQNSGEEIIS